MLYSTFIFNIVGKIINWIRFPDIRICSHIDSTLFRFSISLLAAYQASSNFVQWLQRSTKCVSQWETMVIIPHRFRPFSDLTPRGFGPFPVRPWRFRPPLYENVSFLPISFCIRFILVFKSPLMKSRTMYGDKTRKTIPIWISADFLLRSIFQFDLSYFFM